MAHIIRENAGKKFKMISELFINKNFEYTFVLFVSDQSLPTEIEPTLPRLMCINGRMV